MFALQKSGTSNAISSNTNRILIKKKKLKKNLRSKISLDENEEMFMNEDEDDSAEVKCELQIESQHAEMQEDVAQEEEEEEECGTYDEHAEELVKLLIDMRREHDSEKLSTSSDANFKGILQQLIESSSSGKTGHGSSILQGLVNG